MSSFNSIIPTLPRYYAMLTANPEGTVTSANEQAENLFPSDHPLIGKKISQLVNFRNALDRNLRSVIGYSNLYVIERIPTVIHGNTQQPFTFTWYIEDKYSLVCIFADTMGIQQEDLTNSLNHVPFTLLNSAYPSSQPPAVQTLDVSLADEAANQQTGSFTVETQSCQMISKKNILRENLKILVVDDSQLNRAKMARYLQNLGFSQIVFAENGQEAVNTFASDLFELVIMDMEMPGKNGAEASFLIRKFEQEHNRPTVPILGWTTLSQEMFNLYVAEAFMERPDLNINYPLIRKDAKKKDIEEAIAQFFDFSIVGPKQFVISH
jgi:CheY-like chemotaxis protein